MELNFTKFINREFPRAYVPAKADERRIDCISPDCPKPHNHMFVNATSGRFICHRCGIAGDYKAFMCLYYNMPFFEIKANYGAIYGLEESHYSQVRKAADKISASYSDEVDKEEGFKIDLPREYCKLTIADPLPVLLKDRNIPSTMAERYMFGLCNTGYYKNRLIIPIRTKKSKSYVAYSLFPKKVLKRYKKLSKKFPNSRSFDKNKKKILNPKSSLSSMLLFNYNNIPTGCKKLFVVEGPFDALRIQLHGYNAVCIFGINMSKIQRNLLLEKQPDELIFMFDGDVWEDEKKLKIVTKATDSITRFFDGTVSRVRLEDGTDPDDIRRRKVFKQIIKDREVLVGGNFNSIYHSIANF